MSASRCVAPDSGVVSLRDFDSLRRFMLQAEATALYSDSRIMSVPVMFMLLPAPLDCCFYTFLIHFYVCRLETRLTLSHISAAPQPQQGRLEIELPLDMSTDTYDTDAAPALQIRKIALASAPVPLRPGTLAVGAHRVSLEGAHRPPAASHQAADYNVLPNTHLSAAAHTQA
jgi:hypothetical protein